MHNDYMVIGGVRYRVEVNWNALTDFLAEIGQDSMQGLADMDHLKPSEITALMAAAINEGSRLDGSEARVSPRAIGAAVSIANVKEFLDIYVRQSTPACPVPEGDVKKKEAGLE